MKQFQNILLATLLIVIPACGLMNFMLDPAEQQQTEQLDAAIDEQDTVADNTGTQVKVAADTVVEKAKAGDLEGAQAALAEFDVLLQAYETALAKENALINERNDYVQASMQDGGLETLATTIHPLGAVGLTLLTGMLARFGSKKSASQMKKGMVNLLKLKGLSAVADFKRAYGLGHTNETAAELLNAAKLVAFKQGDKDTLLKIEAITDVEQEHSSNTES